MSGVHGALENDPEAQGHALAESAWIEVIQRMDEVYGELLHSQETLEAKHRELAEAHHLTEGVLAAMSDVLVVCDPHGQIRQVNRAILRLSAYTEAELIQQRLPILAGDDAGCERFNTLLQAPVQEHHDWEIPLQRKTGEPIPVTWNISPLHDGDGRYAGFVAVGRPVGELKRAYAELQSAHLALQSAQRQLVQAEKLASLGKLVAGVAHELNNPISFILGNAHAMARYSTRLREYLAAIHRLPLPPVIHELRAALKMDRLLDDLPSLTAGLMEGAERSSEIVDALKRFSAVEDSIRQRVDLAEIAQRALHWVSQATSQRVAQRCIGLDAPVWVEGSANQLQQVLVNLIQNGFDAVEGRTEGAIQIELHHATPEQGIELSVCDNGAGIPEAALLKVFDPFFTTKAVGKGTGLGLSISHGIVERHRGTLSAANRPEGGACFTVHLPWPTAAD